MTRPYRRDGGTYWFRLHVPPDLIPAIGKAELRRSLRTKDPAEAKVRLPLALAELHREWELIRRGPQPLNRQQVLAVAGEAYRELTALGARRPPLMPSYGPPSVPFTVASPLLLKMPVSGSSAPPLIRSLPAMGSSRTRPGRTRKVPDGFPA